MTDTIQLDVLKEWIAKNPNQDLKLPKVKYEATEKVQNGWESQQVEPQTPLSCILYLTDSMYSLLPITGRPLILRDKCTELESSFTTILKGRQFPIRRTAEAIIAASTGGSSACSTLGWNALCRLFEIQIVWFDENQKLMQFYPSELHTWSQETPIHFISSLANQVWNPPKGWNQSNFATWLANKEHEGWKIKYEEVDGTLEELKELSRKLNDIPSTKLNKADLGKRLGRTRAVKHLCEWNA